MTTRAVGVLATTAPSGASRQVRSVVIIEH